VRVVVGSSKGSSWTVARIVADPNIGAIAIVSPRVEVGEAAPDSLAAHYGIAYVVGDPLVTSGSGTAVSAAASSGTARAHTEHPPGPGRAVAVAGPNGSAR
jgi:hypothetical protein